ncbi:MAG: DUF2164 domain-containing protein [Methanoregula sp.]|nr:DUF2164 domain-containing protein [Methanoregula sp.]
MRKDSPINLSKERKAAMIAEIKHYFAKERNEELGDLAAEMVLDFIVEKLAPEFYNQGVDNAYRFMKEATEDLMGVRVG